MTDHVPPWVGCCEHCGARLKRHEKDRRFCEKCVDEGVFDYYPEDYATEIEED